MEKNSRHLIKINLPGGILYPGDLIEVLAIANQAEVSNFRFGIRQQLIFWIDASAREDIEDAFLVADITYEIDADEYPNIMSSYVTEEILNTPNWLREGVYKDILNAFNHRPKLKINIVDHAQNLIPFFTGHLNFISSEVSNYWFLHIRYPKSNEMFSWPTLVYSEDISLLSKILEEKILDQSFGENIENAGMVMYQQIVEEQHLTGQAYQKPLQHTSFQLPYYEGFNKYGENKLWLGIYRRNEEFDLELLKEIAEICIKTRVGQLYTTAWKSIIIKGIDENDRKYWSHLLDKYRLNVRHAANELNWQLEDVCEEALNLKLHLVKCFEEADLRTYRLCFAIKTKPNTGLFGSVIIRKRTAKTDDGADLYEVLHTKNFNPNNKNYIVFIESCVKENLGRNLIALSEYYYGLQLNLALPNFDQRISKQKNEELVQVYQCKNCKTIYDDAFGDEINNVKIGVKFEEINTYFCPICESPKEDFIKTQFKKQLI